MKHQIQKVIILPLLFSLVLLTSCEEEQDKTSIEITSPQQGDTFVRGDNVAISWTAKGSVYETFCVVNGSTHGRTSSSSGSFTWRAYSTRVGGIEPITAHVTTENGGDAYHTIYVTVEDN